MQVVETFINHTEQPMLVCAPMYAPYYLPGGLLKPALAAQLGGGRPILSFFAVVGAEKHAVDVYVTAAHGATPGRPAVFYLLLGSDIFSTRTRGTVYQHERWVGCAARGAEGQMGAAGQREQSSTVHACAPPLYTAAPHACPPHPSPFACPCPRACSEAAELTFFSVFNQAVAHVVETLGVSALQFHDYHGGWAHGQLLRVSGMFLMA